MHRIFFGVKRVHLLALRYSRLFIGDSPLFTPARFDMMRIVHVHDLQGVSVPQANIRLLLGVSAAVVSRMLRALERMGLIVRTRDERDARCKNVRLTGPGRVGIQATMRDLIDSGILLSDLRDLTEPHENRLGSFAKILDFYRHCFNDPAPFPHPWRCGQLDTGWPRRFFEPPQWPFAPRER